MPEIHPQCEKTGIPESGIPAQVQEILVQNGLLGFLIKEMHFVQIKCNL